MLEKSKISSLNTQTFALQDLQGMWKPTCPVQVSTLPCPGQRVFLEICPVSCSEQGRFCPALCTPLGSITFFYDVCSSTKKDFYNVDIDKLLLFSQKGTHFVKRIKHRLFHCLSDWVMNNCIRCLLVSFYRWYVIVLQLLR